MKSLAPCIAIATLICTAVAADVTLVREGRAVATIVVPADCSEQVRAAAAQLVSHIEKSSGAGLPIVAEADLQVGPDDPLILIGPVALWPARFADGLDDDGFVIRTAGRAVSICGPSDWGTEFGVYELLERYVGVRWLLPGEHGTDVPRHETITIPDGEIVDQPVFFSRLFSGLKGGPQVEWARFNRMHGRVQFHHNLNRLFPPEQYTQSHPEFFPMLDGQTRYLARDAQDHGWQPCFTAPGIVDEAINNIVQYFNDNPQATSYSLGMNDSGRFCACPDCMARISGEQNYLGWVDYSDLYYDWCNQIIEGVLKVHPDKWFGCLAYFNVSTPPKHVKVHERLVPYITYDRMKWIDPEMRAAGVAATREWDEAVPTFAWYDYIYGSPYCLPRVYFHHAQSYLQFGAENGVKAHYAEIYPNWGEGPKPYIHLKLWWNPDRDVDALLDEWYVRCVGPDAAASLKQYYAIWERFWTQDILNSAWFPKTGTWLPFSSAAYLADVKREDITQSRRLLEETISRCQTDQQRARAQLLEKAFQYYEASALAYQAQPQFAPVRTDTEENALAAVDQAVEGMAMAARRRTLALEEFEQHPVLVHPLPPSRYGGVSGDSWGTGGLWAVADWLRRGDNAVRRRVSELAEQSDTPIVREQASMVLAIVDGTAELASGNHSFEEGDGAAATGWSFWRKPDTGEAPPIGTMARSTDVAHDGQYSLLCDAMMRGGPVHTMDFPGPGRYVALAWVYTPEDQVSNGTVELSVTPLDQDGRNMSGYSTKMQPEAGEWQLMVVGMDLPAAVGDRQITRLRLVPIVDGFDKDAGKVYFDEVGLHRVQ